jgi:hypothetical protein
MPDIPLDTADTDPIQDALRLANEPSSNTPYFGATVPHEQTPTGFYLAGKISDIGRSLLKGSTEVPQESVVGQRLADRLGSIPHAMYEYATDTIPNALRIAGSAARNQYTPETDPTSESYDPTALGRSTYEMAKLASGMPRVTGASVPAGALMAGAGKQIKELIPHPNIDSVKIVEEPGYIYHATNMDNLQSIAKEGKLKTHGPSYGTDQDMWPDGGTDKRSYWTNNTKTAAFFYPEGSPPALIRSRQHIVQPKRESTGDLFTKKIVPAKELEYMSADGWRPLVE